MIGNLNIEFYPALYPIHKFGFSNFGNLLIIEHTKLKILNIAKSILTVYMTGY